MKVFNRGNQLNQNYIPDQEELKVISKINSIIRSDYKLIRITSTMVEKSIIDASGQLRDLFRKGAIVDFDHVDKGPMHKLILNVGLYVDPQGIIETKVSFYRPITKDGDPRFWPYGIGKKLIVGSLMLLTVIAEKLVLIPVIDSDELFDLLRCEFGSSEQFELIDLFKSLYLPFKDKWIPSVSPYKSNPKDVGDTLERILGLDPNSSKKADINDILEVKSKRSSGGTRNSLFSMVPDWKNSPIDGSKSMILNYGYVSTVHPGFIDLYVTVNAKENNQGLFLSNQYELDLLAQYHINDGVTCFWNHSDLNERLQTKHPNTIWVEAIEKIIDGKIHFKYHNQMSFSSNPIFSQFLALIDGSIITFDWRGKVKPDGTAYRDHGHVFRISPKDRHLLFTDHEEFRI